MRKCFTGVPKHYKTINFFIVECVDNLLLRIFWCVNSKKEKKLCNAAYVVQLVPFDLSDIFCYPACLKVSGFYYMYTCWLV